MIDNSTARLAPGVNDENSLRGKALDPQLIMRRVLPEIGRAYDFEPDKTGF
jgi:hypothetical protein